jgi:hypothetical protein
MAKSKPIGVRFDLIQYEFILKNNPQLKTPQSVLNFLMSFYQSVMVMDDNFEIKPKNDLTPKEMINSYNFEQKAEIKPKNDNPEPPSHLSGIDLTIWKAENWK